MNGDRLKTLEHGFMDGALTDAEETELKQWVQAQPEHPLAPYFTMVDEAEELTMPDFKSRLVLTEEPKRKLSWWKLAAAVLALSIAGFLLKDQFLRDSPKAFSEAEIDESYKATMETLSAMAGFLDKSLSDTREAIDLSKPFEKLNELKNENSK